MCELEELRLIKVLKENIDIAKPKLSDKYKGVFSNETLTPTPCSVST